jgi:hypothetical protein
MLEFIVVRKELKRISPSLLWSVRQSLHSYVPAQQNFNRLHMLEADVKTLILTKVIPQEIGVFVQIHRLHRQFAKPFPSLDIRLRFRRQLAAPSLAAPPHHISIRKPHGDSVCRVRTGRPAQACRHSEFFFLYFISLGNVTAGRR